MIANIIIELNCIKYFIPMESNIINNDLENSPNNPHFLEGAIPQFQRSMKNI